MRGTDDRKQKHFPKLQSYRMAKPSTDSQIFSRLYQFKPSLTELAKVSDLVNDFENMNKYKMRNNTFDIIIPFDFDLSPAHTDSFSFSCYDTSPF